MTNTGIDPVLDLTNLVHQHTRKFDNVGWQTTVLTLHHLTDPTQMCNGYRGYDAVFGQMAAQSVDRLGLLPNEEIPCSKRHARRLLLNALHRNEPHRRSSLPCRAFSTFIRSPGPNNRCATGSEASAMASASALSFGGKMIHWIIFFSASL